MRLDELTRGDFPILERVVNGRPLVYLDSGASSQKPRSVIEAMSRYYERSHANVHRSIHTLGEEATELYELARDRVQRFIGAARREEVVVTRGTTDGLGLVAETLGRTLRPGDELVVTELEHHSNLIPWQLVARDRGAVLKAVPVRADGTLDLDALDRLLGPKTRVVAFAHVSNVLGTINPVQAIVRRARAVGALTVVDGAQAAPHLRLDMSALECDFYVFSAHKMLGPTGIGVLYGRYDVLSRLEPGRGGSEMIKEVWIDRAQWNDLPWRYEPGTPPIAEAVGLTAAIEYLEKLGMDRVAQHEQMLAARAVRGLAALPGVRVFGPAAEQPRGAVVAFAVDGLHPHDVAALLDQDGIAVRAGHHCAQPLMRCLGVAGTTRASFSVFNSPNEVDQLVGAVGALHTKL
ncbi:MAG: SufS family cysteine desulfurase [Candidatus Rokubacteria bacterium]|nr:SufS family cysteine desulfurase [Candidatus Rokubacteria bacterium]